MTTATKPLYEAHGECNTSARVFNNDRGGFNVVGHDADANESYSLRCGIKTFEAAKAYADTIHPMPTLDQAVTSAIELMDASEDSIHSVNIEWRAVNGHKYKATFGGLIRNVERITKS